MGWIFLFLFVPGLLLLLFVASQFVFRGRQEIDDATQLKQDDEDEEPSL